MDLDAGLIQRRDRKRRLGYCRSWSGQLLYDSHRIGSGNIDPADLTLFGISLYFKSFSFCHRPCHS